MISPAGGSGPNPLEGYPREIHSCTTLNAVSRPRRRIRHVELLRNRCFTAAGNQVRTPLPLMWLCSARMVGEGPSRIPSCVCPNLAWSARMVAGPIRPSWATPTYHCRDLITYAPCAASFGVAGLVIHR